MISTLREIDSKRCYETSLIFIFADHTVMPAVYCWKDEEDVCKFAGRDEAWKLLSAPHNRKHKEVFRGAITWLSCRTSRLVTFAIVMDSFRPT